jgi:hypothetical protein
MSGVWPVGSAVHSTLSEAARDCKLVFVAGLSGMGKSLMLRELARLAAEHARPIHLLQWDVARLAFDTPAILARYPEVDGVTHAVIRRAVGTWARRGVLDWLIEHSTTNAILLGELPLIGNRLVELARPADDPLEPILRGTTCQFVLPVPSLEVRAAIVAARAREMAAPGHERELANAPPDLLRAHWQEIAEAAHTLGIEPDRRGGSYDPDVYAATYRHVLRHRRVVTVTVDRVVRVEGSTYDLPPLIGELAPTATQVAEAMTAVERIDPRQLDAETRGWFHL